MKVSLLKPDRHEANATPLLLHQQQRGTPHSPDVWLLLTAGVLRRSEAPPLPHGAGHLRVQPPHEHTAAQQERRRLLRPVGGCDMWREEDLPVS